MHTNRRKPKPQFVVELKGLYPEDIPLRLVAKVLGALQRLLRAKRESEGLSQDEDEFSIRVVDITRGSAGYRCVSTDSAFALQHLGHVGKLLDNDQADSTIALAFPYLKTLSEVAKKGHCRIVIREPDRSREGVVARIEPETYKKLEAAHTVAGSATVFGDLLRIGGATRPKCVLRPNNQKELVYCGLSQALARQLAPMLYRRVVLEGEARWLRTTWNIVAFRVARIVPYRKRDLSEARKALRKAGAARWDKIPDSEIMDA